MVKSKRQINLGVFLYTVVISLCCTYSSCDRIKAITCRSISYDCIMNLTDSTDQHLVFTRLIRINNSCYEAKCIYTHDESDPVYQLIKGKDTLEFERDALFIGDSIMDVDKDGFEDWLIQFYMTQGKMNVVYYYIPEEKRLDPDADTIFLSR